MNTTLHPRNIHPPETQTTHVMSVSLPDDLRRLRLSDRLTLQIGLWLLQRAQRPRRRRAARVTLIDPLAVERQRHTADAVASLTFDLHRQMR